LQRRHRWQANEPFDGRSTGFPPPCRLRVAVAIGCTMHGQTSIGIFTDRSAA
jgi:hypothetical protein